jgi:photosystem II stability/assembly factor-like uncharacterized protein
VARGTSSMIPPTTCRSSHLRWAFIFLCLPLCCMSYIPHDVIAAVTASEDGEIVFTISGGQLLRSDDGGFNWKRMMKGMHCIENSCGMPDELYLVASPSYKSDKTVFFGSKKYGLRSSIDGGFNWLPVGQDQFHHCLGKGHLSLSPKFGSNTDNLMLVVGEDVSNEGSFNLYRSADARNKTFEVVDLTLALDGGSLEGCAVLYSLSESVHFLGTQSGEILASEDGGRVWKPVQGVLANADIRKIVGMSGKHKRKEETDLYFMIEVMLELASIQKIDDRYMHLTT